jgi:hypothetical protein
MQAPEEMDETHLAVCGYRVKGSWEMPLSQHLITGLQVTLLNLRADFA